MSGKTLSESVDQWGIPMSNPSRSLEEREALPKYQWIELDDLSPYAPEILDLISKSYERIGGHHDFKTLSDVEKSGLSAFVVDLDSDPEVDAVLIDKETRFGAKGVATGTDGSREAKDSAIDKKIKLLNKRGHYAEVSGAIAKILLKSGVDVVSDEEQIREILNKEITFVGENPEFPGTHGWYERMIGGKPTLKILLGRPEGEPIEEGARGDWEKEGYEIVVKGPFMDRIGDGEYVVDVLAPDGSEAAYFKFNRNNHTIPMSIHVMEAEVLDSHKRKGIASAVYRKMETMLGAKILSEPDGQSDDARALWSQSNRPFGESVDKWGIPDA